MRKIARTSRKPASISPKNPDDIADILIDLRAARDEDPSHPHLPARWSTSLKNAARLHKNPLRSAGFRVLKAPDIPSVLIELGYVSNRGRPQAARFRTNGGRGVSDAVTQAVHTYFTTSADGAGGRP